MKSECFNNSENNHSVPHPLNTLGWRQYCNCSSELNLASDHGVGWIMPCRVSIIMNWWNSWPYLPLFSQNGHLMGHYALLIGIPYLFSDRQQSHMHLILTVQLRRWSEWHHVHIAAGSRAARWPALCEGCECPTGKCSHWWFASCTPHRCPGWDREEGTRWNVLRRPENWTEQHQCSFSVFWVI